MSGLIFSYLSGFLFAVGLVISGMTNPNIVKGFLDIFGQWDPSLVFVMGGAVGVNLITFNLLKRRKPLCSELHFLPSTKDLDKKLLIGSALFGIGWGLIGICPGPGLVNLVTMKADFLIFVVSMLVGMFVFKMTKKV